MRSVCNNIKSNWKEPTDFTKRTFLWEKKRDSTHNLRNDHYKLFAESSEKKSIFDKNQEEALIKTKRQRVEEEHKKREERGSRLNISKQTQLDQKKRNFFERMEKFNAKLKDKESSNGKANNSKIKEKIVLESEREKRDEEILRSEKVTFQKKLQENENRRREKEIKKKKLESEREKLRKIIFNEVSLIKK